MPPKKKGGAGVIIDGVDTSAMTREQLEVFALRIKEENEREREERNYFQLERDKLRTFWEITRNELDETLAKLRNKDRQIEESTEKNEEELKFYKQKVKHLQFEHQSNLTDIRAQSLVSLKKAEDDYVEQARELLKDKRALKQQFREQELAHQDQINQLRLQFNEELSLARSDFESKSKGLEVKYERKFNELRTELNTKHNMEIAEVEERKNAHITELTKNHEAAFNEMKNYYNDITLNNLALISTLKDQMEVLRKQNERMAKQVADLTAENRKLIEPLHQAQNDVMEYKRQMQNYEKDKTSLANTKAKLASTVKELSELRWANDALELRFEKLQADRDELHKRFVKAILEVQQKTGSKNILLQKRIKVLNEELEQREAVVGELSMKAEEPMSEINQKLASILAKKDMIINDLQYELARVCKAHDDMLATYEEKLLAYGIPSRELGFTPLRILPSGQGGLAKAPAGLVTKNK